jgi:hypothetical protein
MRAGLAAFASVAVLVISAAAIITSSETAYAQIGANSRFKNPGWYKGVFCYKVGSKGCERRAAQYGNGGKY